MITTARRSTLGLGVPPFRNALAVSQIPQGFRLAIQGRFAGLGHRLTDSLSAILEAWEFLGQQSYMTMGMGEKEGEEELKSMACSI